MCVCGGGGQRGKTGIWTSGESLETHRSMLSSNCDHKSSTGKLYGDVINIYGAVRVFQMIERAFVGELGTGLQISGRHQIQERLKMEVMM